VRKHMVIIQKYSEKWDRRRAGNPSNACAYSLDYPLD